MPRPSRLANCRRAAHFSAMAARRDCAASKNAGGSLAMPVTVRTEALVPIAVEPGRFHGWRPPTSSTTAALQELGTSHGLWKPSAQTECFLEAPAQALRSIGPCPAPTAPSAPARAVADFSLRSLKRSVPPAVPAIPVSLGGLARRRASVDLSAINCRPLLAPPGHRFLLRPCPAAYTMPRASGRPRIVAAGQAPCWPAPGANGRAACPRRYIAGSESHKMMQAPGFVAKPTATEAGTMR